MIRAMRTLVVTRRFLTAGKPGETKTIEQLGWTDEMFDEFCDADNGMEIHFDAPAAPTAVTVETLPAGTRSGPVSPEAGQ